MKHSLKTEPRFEEFFALAHAGWVAKTFPLAANPENGKKLSFWVDDSVLAIYSDWLHIAGLALRGQDMPIWPVNIGFCASDML